MGRFSRRGFFIAAAGSSLAAAGCSQAMEPIERAGQPRLDLSLVAFSMRQYLQADPDAEGAMDLFGFVDWAAELGFDAVELTSYYFPDPVERAHVHDLKRHCHLQGMPISAGGIRNNLTHPPGSSQAEADLQHIEAWAQHYHRLGTTPIRIFSGSPAGGSGEDEVINNIIENLKRACDIGQKYGVMMAIENHGYLRQPDRFARVIDAMDSPWFGITLDSDNWDVPDPYAPFERFAPYAVNVHMKAKVTPQGQPSQPADLGRLMKALTDAGYRGYVGLEYEEAEDPYEAIPRLYQMMRDAG